MALLTHPADEAINVEGWPFPVVVAKWRRHSMRMSQPTLQIRKPLAGYAAVIALQFNAEVTSAIPRGGDQGATGAGEGIAENLSSLKFSEVGRLPKGKMLPLTRQLSCASRTISSR